MMRYFWLTLSMNGKKALSKRGAFLASLIVTCFKQGFFIVSWNFFFVKYHAVGNWDFSQMVFMYGLITLGFGLTELFFYGIKGLPRLIETRGLDFFLVQPKNLIWNIALSKVDPSSLGEVILGFLLIGYAGEIANPLVYLLIPLASFFTFSLHLYIQSLQFFFREGSSSFVRELSQLANIVVSQPGSAYQGLFRYITWTLLPVAFLGFFPVEFIRTGEWSHFFIACGGSFLFFLGAKAVFYRGLRRYI